LELLEELVPEEDWFVNADGVPIEPVDRSARRIYAAQRQLNIGHISRAMSILQNKPVELVSEDTFAELTAMFPDNDLSLLPAIKHSDTPFEADAFDIREAIDKPKPGGACGPSRWSPDLFRVLAKEGGLFNSLYAEALTMLINNHEWITPQLATLFLGGRLLAPEKPRSQGAVVRHRAIGVSEPPLQHLQLLSYLKIDQGWLTELFTIFGKLSQYGIGVPDGVPKAFRIMETLLLLVHDRDLEGFAVAQFDVADAYQMLDRGLVFATIYRHAQLKPLWGIANLLFRFAAPRYVKLADGSTRVIFQKLGGTQGWTLMSTVYCVAVLDNIKARLALAGPEKLYEQM